MVPPYVLYCPPGILMSILRSYRRPDSPSYILPWWSNVIIPERSRDAHETYVPSQVAVAPLLKCLGLASRLPHHRAIPTALVPAGAVVLRCKAVRGGCCYAWLTPPILFLLVLNPSYAGTPCNTSE